MAFNIIKWLFGREDTTGQQERASAQSFLDESAAETATDGLEAYIQCMAFWSVVRRIGDALGAVEWETYRRGQKVKAREYWAWNYAPNPNQTRQEFFRRLAGQLYTRQEALIVEYHGGRYVADGYSVDKHLTGDIYRDITVESEQIPGTFQASDVLLLRLDGGRIRQVLAGITAAEGKLLSMSTKAYTRSTGRHGILRVDDQAEADPDFEETYDELINDKFKKYFSADSAVLPLFNGYDYTENTTNGYTAAGTSTTRDIKALVDDIIGLTAQALGVPASIGTGKEITDADFKAFLTSPVQPIVRQIECEINRKLYGQGLVYAGTYISANLGSIRYTDLFDVANPIDKLIGSGAFCVNDIRARLGMDVIDAPWANQHWMTKNYSSVEDLLVCVGPEGSSGSIDTNNPGEPDGKEVTDE